MGTDKAGEGQFWRAWDKRPGPKSRERPQSTFVSGDHTAKVQKKRSKDVICGWRATIKSVHGRSTNEHKRPGVHASVMSGHVQRCIRRRDETPQLGVLSQASISGGGPAQSKVRANMPAAQQRRAAPHLPRLAAKAGHAATERGGLHSSASPIFTGQ